MSSAHTSRTQERDLPVLHVDIDRLEWLVPAPDGAVHGFAPYPEPLPREIAERAAARAAELGVRPRSCVLALGPELVLQRVVELPVLPPRELRDVLRRRAAQALGLEDEEDVLFHARPYGIPVGENGDQADSWTLYVQRRSFVRELQSALLRLGIRVRRTVVARTCLVARAPELLEEPAHAYVVLAGGPWETTVALICDGEVWFETLLNTAITLDDPGTHLTLVQELRNLGGWWRKTGHEAEIEAVVSIGMEAGLFETLGAAMRAALGAVRFVTGDESVAPRLEALAACRSSGPLSVELGLRNPPRWARVVPVAILLVAVALAGGWTLRERVMLRLAETEVELARYEGEMTRLARAGAREADLDRARTELLEQGQIVGALARSGLHLGELVPELLGAFHGLAELASISATSDGERRVRLGGRTAGDAVRSQEALTRLARRLEASRALVHVAVVPPTHVPDEEEGASLTFRVEGSLEDRP